MSRYHIVEIVDRETGRVVDTFDSRLDCNDTENACGGCGACMLIAGEHLGNFEERRVDRDTLQDDAKTWTIPPGRKLRRWSLERRGPEGPDSRGFIRLRARFGLFEVYTDIVLADAFAAERDFALFVEYLGGFRDEKLRGMM